MGSNPTSSASTTSAFSERDDRWSAWGSLPVRQRGHPVCSTGPASWQSWPTRDQTQSSSRSERPNIATRTSNAGRVQATRRRLRRLLPPDLTAGRRLGRADGRPSRWEPRSRPTPRVEGPGRTVLACPTPSRKHPHQPTRHLGRACSAASSMADFVGSAACPWRSLGLSACHGIHRPPGPRARQTARPGNRKGQDMNEPSVSFAGNLTDQPEVRYTEGGIARAMFRVAVSGRRGPGGIVLHRGRVAGPGRACRRVIVEGEPGRGHGLTPAAELDRRGRQRPIHCRGAGRGAGTEPAVGVGDHDQDDEQQPGAAASWTSAVGERNAGGEAACQRSAPSLLILRVCLAHLILDAP